MLEEFSFKDENIDEDYFLDCCFLQHLLEDFEEQNEDGLFGFVKKRVGKNEFIQEFKKVNDEYAEIISDMIISRVCMMSFEKIQKLLESRY